MRFSAFVLIAFTTCGALAFAPSVVFTRSRYASNLFSEQPEGEEGLDLDLEEMFQM
jgi:hypothetical protein